MTIERLLAWAITQEKISPTILVQWSAPPDSDPSSYPVPNFDGPKTVKTLMLFRLGRRLGRQPEYAEQDISQIGFVAHTWSLFDPKEVPPKKRTSHNALPKEEFSLVLMSASPPFENTKLLSTITYDKQGRFRDIGAFSEDISGGEIMTQAFLAGWRSRKVPNEEIEPLPDIHAFLS